ncbi:hypothetical protein DAI22_07g200700 [Oryza sativa Japonica Group]|nr:hypothetical protein DAI22_07g200700 [Oryza sativa Japonica Group]
MEKAAPRGRDPTNDIPFTILPRATLPSSSARKNRSSSSSPRPHHVLHLRGPTLFVAPPPRPASAPPLPPQLLVIVGSPVCLPRRRRRRGRFPTLPPPPRLPHRAAPIAAPPQHLHRRHPHRDTPELCIAADRRSCSPSSTTPPSLPSLRCAASLPGVPIPSSPRHFPICRPACLPPRRPHPFLATSLPHSPPPLHASRRNPAAEPTGELTAVPAGRRQSPSPRRSALHCRGISPPNGRRSRSTPPSSHADSMSNPYLTTVSTCGSS